jgi:glutamate racemase
MTSNNRTIGVFDSGFGGLTVLRALLPLIPGARYLYLGDTARLPYGSKSRDTIARYAVSSAKFLHDQGADLLVIACNTATALALADIQQALPIPVIGVVEPGAQAAHAAATDGADRRNAVIPSEARSAKSRVPRISTEPPQTLGAPEPALSLSKGPDSGTWVGPPQLSPQTTKNNTVILSEAKDPCISPGPPPTSTQAQVLVLATPATVQSRAYTRALNALNLEAHEKACPLLVPLVEEGWINHPVTDEVLRIYLTEALAQAPAANTLLLGCTHYPLLEPAIRRILASIHHPLTLIDSAEATAHAVAAHLKLNPHHSQHKAQSSQCTFYATDSVEKFQHLGSSFLGQPVAQVNLIDLGG